MDDFVINVCKILNVMHVVPAGFKPSVNQIKGQITSSMTEMTPVVNSNATNIHRYFPWFESGEIHFLSATGVVETNRHWLRFTV
jgi:hypothetical protein